MKNLFRVLRIGSSQVPSLSVGCRSGSHRRGTILVSVMMIGSILVALSVSLLGLATQQVHNRARYETYKDEFAAAEFVLNKTLGQIQFMNQSRAANFLEKIAALDDASPTLPGYTFSDYTITKVFEGQKVIPAGQEFELMDSYTITYQVDITAKKTGGTAGRFDHPGVRLRQNFSIEYILMNAFAIFYDDTLEIAPGASMTVTGRVHSNGNAYVQSNSGLDFMQQVTVAGSLYHGRYGESGQSGSNGEVRFNNGGAGLVSMNTGGGWFDSTSPDWATGALDRWSGYVRDSKQGVSRMGLPIPSAVDPHAIIERADDANDCYAVQQEKFENKAGLKIFRKSNGSSTSGDITMEDYDGNAVLPTYVVGGVTKSILTQTTFYDAREKKTIASIDLNIANLIESGKGPENGIVYVSSANLGSNLAALRLVNGTRLPSKGGGFTVATENPLYIKGNYNTTNRQLAMVVADALTLLSDSWNDANGNKALSYRTAATTTVYAVCMQGIVASSGGKYSGGVENYFRLLENWDGKDLNFEGSLINLWLSTKATGLWPGTGTVYNAPKRAWAWDDALGGLNGPPGATRSVHVVRDEWEMPVAEE
jgi:hypothetical protein